MSSKRAIRRRQCEGKRAYPSLKSAYGAQRGHAQTLGETLGIYWCCFCRNYHLGHAVSPERRTRRNFKELVRP